METGYSNNFLDVVRANPGAKTFDVRFMDGRVEQMRLFVSDAGGYDALCRFKTRSRRYGYILDLNGIDGIRPHRMTKISPEMKFERDCDKVIALLEASGLWDNILSDVRYLKSIGYAKTNYYYNGCCYNFDVSVKEREVLSRQVPAQFSSSTAGMLLNAKFVAVRMADSDWMNEQYREDIKRAIRDGKEYHHRTECRSYDRTFEYDPERRKAWYSLEYRGCGNGHYYLALNAEKAIFCEDD